MTNETNEVTSTEVIKDAAVIVELQDDQLQEVAGGTAIIDIG